MLLEICANGLKSAEIAQREGAHRIELCTDLTIGGLTPSREIISTAIQKLEIPVHVLVRPREGDFNYTTKEFVRMEHTIEFCKAQGCAGVVFGILDADGRLDSQRLRHLLDLARPMKVTFHRAFDLCSDPLESCSELIRLGVDRLLSSGQQPTAFEGRKLLTALLRKFGNDLEIMPGGGIDQHNAQFFKMDGFPAIHLSGISKRRPSSGHWLFGGAKGITNPDTVREVRAICDSCA